MDVEIEIQKQKFLLTFLVLEKSNTSLTMGRGKEDVCRIVKPNKHIKSFLINSELIVIIAIVFHKSRQKVTRGPYLYICCMKCQELPASDPRIITFTRMMIRVFCFHPDMVICIINSVQTESEIIHPEFIFTTIHHPGQDKNTQH